MWKLYHLIYKRDVSYFLLFTFFLLIIYASISIFHIRLEYDVDIFWDKKSKSYINFQRWKRQFGDDKLIIIAFEDTDIFTYQNLALIKSLTKEFEALEYVYKVTSITNVNDIRGSESDFIVKRLIGDIPKDRFSLKRIKNYAINEPLYVKNLISKDTKASAIIIELEDLPEARKEYRKKVMKDVLKILKGIPQDIEFYISGPAALEYYYNSYINDDLKTFLPLVLLFIIIFLSLSFKSLLGVILPLIAILTTLILTMAFLYRCGFYINSITALIPAIILAIVIADSIHLIERCMKWRGYLSSGQDKSFLDYVIRPLAFPCFLTTFTTAVGFFCLTTSEVMPVRQMGLVAGVGIIVAYIITFTLIPLLIDRFNLFRPMDGSIGDNKNKSLTSSFERIFEVLLLKINNIVHSAKKSILYVTILIILFSLWGLSRIVVDTNLLEFFRENTPFFRSTKFIEQHLCGTHILEISVKAPVVDYFKDPIILKKIQDLQEFLSGLPGVDNTISPVDYIKEINKSFHNEDKDFYTIPSSKKLISQYLLLYGSTDIYDFVDSQWRWMTVQVRLNEHSTLKLQEIIKDIKEYLSLNFTPPIYAEVLGTPIMEVESNLATTRGQLRSLALAMGVIFLLFFFIFRSIFIGLISIVPNILPLLINFGIMGIFGIRLDSATSMVSAIGIGIIVDDTIHFLYRFRYEIRKDNDCSQAIYRVLLAKGRPIILTSFILFSGFIILITSRFMPTVYFGILTASMMITALLADLFVLPSLLLIIWPKISYWRIRI